MGEGSFGRGLEHIVSGRCPAANHKKGKQQTNPSKYLYFYNTASIQLINKNMTIFSPPNINFWPGHFFMAGGLIFLVFI